MSERDSDIEFDFFEDEPRRRRLGGRVGPSRGAGRAAAMRRPPASRRCSG